MKSKATIYWRMTFNIILIKLEKKKDEIGKEKSWMLHNIKTFEKKKEQHI